MVINNRSKYDTESVGWDFKTSGRKAYAVAILAAVWAGAKLPQAFIDHAHTIRRQMRKNRTWKSA